MDVGYSGTPLERKIGIKPEQVVFLDGAPDGFALAAPTTARLPRQIEVTLTFHTRLRTLRRRFPQLVERTVTAGMIWVCWPKKSAHMLLLQTQGLRVDLDENAVRELGLAAGMVDVKVAAIDDVWSGLKFVRRLSDR
ncbi:MAG: DUF3052 domain-containing protein [Marmoricola sp.]